MTTPGARRRSGTPFVRRALARGAPWLLLGPAFAGSPRAARADAAGEAMALFLEGAKLRQEGKLDAACLKFAQSVDQSRAGGPTAGMVLNVADCHERAGKLATAWAEFLEASRLYRRRGDAEAIAECSRRASLLESRLPRLSIRVERPAPGLLVRRDGRVVEAAQFGVPSPVDPGAHVVTAEAPGREAFSATVLVEAKGVEVVTIVPALAAHPAPAAPARGRPAAGYVVAGLGVAALGAGATFGVMALVSNAEAERECRAADECASPGDARAARDRANAQAWAANVGVGVGLVGLAAGGYLLVFSPRGPSADPNAAGRGRLGVSPLPGGLRVDVRF